MKEILAHHCNAINYSINQLEKSNILIRRYYIDDNNEQAKR